MTSTPANRFQERVNTLKDDLLSQGRHVYRIVDAAIDAAFDADAERAGRIIAEDRVIDALDIRIERDAVAILDDAIVASCEPEAPNLASRDVRTLLTIVKVNNEFERIADLAVTIARHIETIAEAEEPMPPRFRMFANSVLGMIQETVAAFKDTDAHRARRVLLSDDATEAFRDAILLDNEDQLSKNARSPNFAFTLNRVAAALARMGDHCTNVCEQVIYIDTGKIVRHDADRWSDPEDPDESPPDDTPDNPAP